MKHHHTNYRQACLLAALCLWLAYAAGCATTGSSTIQNPPPAVRMVEEN